MNGRSMKQVAKLGCNVNVERIPNTSDAGGCELMTEINKLQHPQLLNIFKGSGLSATDEFASVLDQTERPTAAGLVLTHRHMTIVPAKLMAPISLRCPRQRWRLPRPINCLLQLNHLIGFSRWPRPQ